MRDNLDPGWDPDFPPPGPNYGCLMLLVLLLAFWALVIWTAARVV